MPDSPDYQMHQNMKWTISMSWILLRQTQFPSKKFHEIKNARVVLDNKLSFNDHVYHITKQATNLLNLCFRNLNVCDPKAKETAYDSLIRPHLKFASSAWSPHASRNIDKIENVQRRAARFVLGDYKLRPWFASIPENFNWKIGNWRCGKKSWKVLEIDEKVLEIENPEIFFNFQISLFFLFIYLVIFIFFSIASPHCL